VATLNVKSDLHTLHCYFLTSLLTAPCVDISTDWQTYVNWQLPTVCHDSCTTICTDLTFLNVSNTRLASQCTAVCRVRRASTWLTVALQSQRLLADTTYVRPVDITWLYHITGSLPSAVKPSLLQARRSGTLYWTVSETPLSVAAISGNYLRRTSSTITHHTQRSRDAV